MNYVLLVNKEVGLANGAYPVCGKSMRVYGHASIDTVRGGVAFKMSIEDYEAAKFDIIGNRSFQQIWVPEFIEETDRLGAMKYNDLFKLAKEKNVPFRFGIPKTELIEALRKVAA